MRFSVLLLCIFFLFSTTVFATEKPDDIKAAGAVLIDKDSKRILWQRKAEQPMPMASTTKIMTAIIALENSKLNKVVEVDRQATLAPKVKMNLSTGEKITMEQLLYALMMQSSNDAAVAIACDICNGSVDDFCAMMTEKAKEIGCEDTVFETPNGLDKGNHHSTPYDMALITAYALENPDFVRIIGTKSISFKTDKNTYAISNKDRFLYEYSGAIGVKTGFTGKAGHCFVGAAKRENMTLISVVLASGWGTSGKNYKWTDTKALMNYGFKNFSYNQLVNKGAIVKTIKVEKGDASQVNLILTQDYSTLMKKDETFDINCTLPDSLQAPVRKGQMIGTAEIMIGKECLAKIPVCAEKNVRKLGFRDYIYDVLKKWASMTSQCHLVS